MKVLLSLFLCSILPLQAALGVGNAKCGQTAAGVTVATAGTVSITAGSAIFVGWSYSPGGGGCGATVTGVANVAGDTFLAIGSANSSGYVCSGLYYVKSSNGSAIDVITVTFSGSVADASVTELPVTGADATAPLDKGPLSGTGLGSPVSSAATGTLAQADEIIVSIAADYYVGDTIGTPSGYTAPAAGACNTTGTVQVKLVYKILSSTTTTTVDYTITGSGYTNVNAATLKQAAAASSFVTPLTVVSP